MPFVSGSNTRITNPRWRTAAVLEKSKNRHIPATVWPNARKFRTVAHVDPLNWSCWPPKFWNFQNPRWRRKIGSLTNRQHRTLSILANKTANMIQQNWNQLPLILSTAASFYIYDRSMTTDWQKCDRWCSCSESADTILIFAVLERWETDLSVVL